MAKGQGWRPIATAPRDWWPDRIVSAPPVLLCSKLGTIDVGHWEHGGGWHEGQYNSGAALDFEPAYWMPLPVPPDVTPAAAFTTAKESQPKRKTKRRRAR